MKLPPSDVRRDFAEFCESDPRERAPQQLDESVRSQVHASLNPSPWAVFARLSLIHLACALFTLSVCPQFGIRVLGEGMGLMHSFMVFGHVGCMVACGAFFLGTTALVAGFALTREDLAVIRRHRTLELGSLALLSLGALFMLNPEGVVLSLALAWLAGSLVGATVLLEGTWRLRASAAAR
jgi:hypothetical protein